MKLLFIEDEINLQTSLAYLLECEGFAVSTASSGEAGLEILRLSPPDIVLLDVNLPGIDGFETARCIRSHPKTRLCPIIMLTARSHPDDIIHGLQKFADDYVTKPFMPQILLARIHALLRRAGHKITSSEDQGGKIHFGSLEIDQYAHYVCVDSQQVKLTKTEYDILLLLANRPERVFTREQIISKVRGDEVFITERVVDFQISCLRKKLGNEGRYIETVWGVGYKFMPDREIH